MSSGSSRDTFFKRQLSEINENRDINSRTENNSGYWRSLIEHNAQRYDRSISRFNNNHQIEDNSASSSNWTERYVSSFRRLRFENSEAVLHELNSYGMNASKMNKLREIRDIFFEASSMWTGPDLSPAYAETYSEAVGIINRVISAYNDTVRAQKIDPTNDPLSLWRDFNTRSDNSAIQAGRYILNNDLDARKALNLPPIDTIQSPQQQNIIELEQHEEGIISYSSSSFEHLAPRQVMQECWQVEGEEPNESITISDIEKYKPKLMAQLQHLKGQRTRAQKEGDHAKVNMYNEAFQEMNLFANALTSQTQASWNQMAESHNEILSKACERIEDDIRFEKLIQNIQSYQN